eukprot:TRINITY_DN30059_c0_g1_i5.p1 TRINITY_DN30059_c0_g1~~TRINITY_DN30059_c0_g1_i5.p1  ORF type:complete len:278 (-),score=16.89 TRINITY_DN30059_c0_g1_i5:103-936(-)
MPCDRKVVYTTLTTWQQRASARAVGSAEDSFPGGVDDALDRFDEVVRCGLSSVYSNPITAALGINYKDCLYCSVSLVWSALDFLMFNYSEGRYWFGARWMLEYAVLPIFVFPLSAAAAVQSTAFMDRLTRCGRLQPSVAEAVSSAVTTLAFGCTFIFFWLPGPVLIHSNQSEHFELVDLLQQLRWLSMALLLIWIIRKSKAAAGKPQLHAELDEGISHHIPGKVDTEARRHLESKPDPGREVQHQSKPTAALHPAELQFDIQGDGDSLASAISLASI